MHPRWLIDVRLNGRPLTVGNIPTNAPGMSDLPSMRKWMGSQISQSVTWADFEWLRSHWKSKILLKGILDPDDISSNMEIGKIPQSSLGLHF